MTLQLTIDCSDPQKMVIFWVEALGYVPEPPPGGHATWRAYWAAVGVPEAAATNAGNTRARYDALRHTVMAGRNLARAIRPA